jgi:hypothetical protein
MSAGVIGNAGHPGGALPPTVMVLGLPARQSPTIVHERHGVEIADADHIGIEREVAGEPKPRRHVELDDLLTKPPGQHEEAAEGREEVAFRPHRHGHPRQHRQPGADEVLVTRRRHDEQLQRLAIPPVPGQRFDQKTGTLQVVLAMQASQGQR